MAMHLRTKQMNNCALVSGLRAENGITGHLILWVFTAAILYILELEYFAFKNIVIELDMHLMILYTHELRLSNICGMFAGRFLPTCKNAMVDKGDGNEKHFL